MAARSSQSSEGMTLEPVLSKLEKFILYETQTHIYIVGGDKRQTNYRIMKLDRTVVPYSRHSEQQSTMASMAQFFSLAGKPAPTKELRLGDILTEYETTYSKKELREMLEMIHEGNRTQGGLVKIASGYGILGFVRFLDCYYICFITQRKKVGSIGGNNIYGVKATEMYPIKPVQANEHKSWGKQMVGAVNRRLNPTQKEIAEQRYLSLFQCVDLTKDFFFSYTYDLTHSLQHNMTASTSKSFPPAPCKDMYAWNHYLTRELEGCVGQLNSSYWVLPVVHGAFMQRKCTTFGRILNISLIARRSRHFAGTRYLKRGVSDEGKVANDVELEQIAHEESIGEGIFSSFLQVRGSIPIFWTQETSMTMPKPPIVLNRVDPTYQATQLHFADLLERYSSPVMVLDLTKHAEKRERELIVANAYRTAIDFLNSTMFNEESIQYCALDFSQVSKLRHLNVLKALEDVAVWSVEQTSFFCSDPHNRILPTGRIEPILRPSRVSTASSNAPSEVEQAVEEKREATVESKDDNADSESQCLDGSIQKMEQKGVLRTNCIDCLDRTNVAQFTIGVHALGKQLTAMGTRDSVTLEPGSQIVLVLMDLYSVVGDQIALQYGGSEAHKKVASGGGNSSRPVGSTGKHKELLTSIRRYYSNAFTDRLKQDAMNVFLGHFVASQHEIPLWDMENDYYLHNFNVQRGAPQTMKRLIAAESNWEEEEEGITPEEDTEFKKIIELNANDLLSGVIDEQGTAVFKIPEGNVEKEKEKILSLKRWKHKVRQRCLQQQQDAKQWWKEALVRHSQDRMWMNLGPPSKRELPARFERIYKPYKLTQFDKLFNSEFMVPIPLCANSGQRQPFTPGRRLGAQNSLDENQSSFSFADQSFSPSSEFSVAEESEAAEDAADKVVTIGRLVRDLLPRVGRSKRRSKGPITPSTTSARGGGGSTYHSHAPPSSLAESDIFIGKIQQPSERHLREFDEFAIFSQQWDRYEKDSLHPTSFYEFTDALWENDLGADDVAAIHRACELGHCATELKVGPYSGLDQAADARVVSTSVHEELLRLTGMSGWAPVNRPTNEQLKEMQGRLEKDGVDTHGVVGQITEGVNSALESQAAYDTVLDLHELANPRSSLTDQSSIYTYCGQFQQDELMCDSPMHSLLGANFTPDPYHANSSSNSLPPPTTPVPDYFSEVPSTPFSKGSFTERSNRSRASPERPEEGIRASFGSEDIGDEMDISIGQSEIWALIDGRPQQGGFSRRRATESPSLSIDLRSVVKGGEAFVPRGELYATKENSYMLLNESAKCIMECQSRRT